MKIIALTIISLSAILFTNAQEKIYDAATISEQLKKNAYSVKREEVLEFEVKAINKASFKVHKVVTVLNENGKDELIFHEFTDKFMSLEGVSIQLFDSKGGIIRKYKRSDLSMQTAGEGLVPDGKVYFIELPAPNYPITIQTDYELKFTGLLNYPRYQVQLPEQSVENSVYIAKVPPELDLRFKGINTPLTPVITNDAKIKTYSWFIKNLAALEYEAGSLNYASRYPHILISPTKFELDEYEGDMSSWASFGKWYGLLAKAANNLTPERKSFFQSLVKNAQDDREKIKIIYNYLQANCRYVLISLGIGGFKPFDANFVDNKKYGDCKALSNYAQACLNAVGIKSYQALINSDYNKAPVDPSFPYNGFNHVILCIPAQKDTTWLECTSTTTDFNVLGNFTENKYALLITEDGGKLVPTPKSKASENIFSSNSIIELSDDYSGVVKITLNTTGEYKQDLANYINNQTKDDQKKFLVNYIGYPQPDDFEIEYDQLNKNMPTKITMGILKIPEFTAGKKVFLNPRMYKIWSSELPKSENRTQDFYFEHPFIKIDTTIYQLPQGFGLETLPKARNISFEYGSFNSSYEFDETKKLIRSISKLELNEYKIPVAKFTATKDFFNKVLEEYTEKLVIRRL
jgi:transglutaminase-like putative cysteine protease